MEENELRNKVTDYLEAFEARDLSHCLDFYHEDATLIFHTGTYQGKKEIETWHKDRFAADLRLTELEKLSVDGDVVTVEGIATSKRLRAWKIASLNGIVTFHFVGNGKIKKAKFSAKMNPLDLLSSNP